MKITKEHVLDVAIAMSRFQNYRTITREALAERAGCSGPMIAYLFGSSQGMRDAIELHGIATKNERIVKQFLANDERNSL